MRAITTEFIAATLNSAPLIRASSGARHCTITYPAEPATIEQAHFEAARELAKILGFFGRHITGEDLITGYVFVFEIPR